MHPYPFKQMFKDVVVELPNNANEQEMKTTKAGATEAYTAVTFL